jgi:hypothetical protein
MIRIDPIIKLAIVVAIGITITMVLGIGNPNDHDKLLIINKSQANSAHLPSTVKVGGFPLENYLAMEK